MITSAAAQVGTPEALLKTKGLVRSGDFFILAAELDIQSSYQESVTLLQKSIEEGRDESDRLVQQRTATESLRDLVKQKISLKIRLGQANEVRERIQIAVRLREIDERIDPLEDEIRLTEKPRFSERDFADLGERIFNSLVDLQNSIDEVSRIYKSFSKDETVRAALATINKSAKLGLSPFWQRIAPKVDQDLANLRASRRKVGLPLRIQTPPGVEDDLRRMQGEWKLTHEYLAGVERKNVTGTLVINGDSATWSRRAVTRGVIKFDSTSKLGKITHPISEPGLAEQFDGRYRDGFKGVFKSDGKTLTMYMGNSTHSNPPTNFPPQPIANFLMETWGRQDGLGEIGIDGAWKLVRLSYGPREISPSTVGNPVMKIEGDHFSRLGQFVNSTVILIDQSADPKRIDVTREDGVLKGTTTLGIYRLEGVRLTYISGGLNRYTSVPERPEEAVEYRIYERPSP